MAKMQVIIVNNLVLVFMIIAKNQVHVVFWNRGRHSFVFRQFFVGNCGKMFHPIGRG